MTYNVFGGTLSLTQSISPYTATVHDRWSSLNAHETVVSIDRRERATGRTRLGHATARAASHRTVLGIVNGAERSTCRCLVQRQRAVAPSMMPVSYTHLTLPTIYSV